LLPECYDVDGDDHGMIMVMTTMTMMMISGASTCFSAEFTVNVPNDHLESHMSVNQVNSLHNFSRIVFTWVTESKM
jgi:hypothetical protein